MQKYGSSPWNFLSDQELGERRPGPCGHVMAWLVSERIFQSSYLENLVPDSAVYVWYFGEVIRSWRLSLPQWLIHWWVPNLIGYLEVIDTSGVESNWR